MSLLHPGLLWALLLASIPILIHLLIRHRYPRLRWATMELVLAALKKNKRRMLIQTIILIALRTLIIALLVFTLARPVVPGAWTFIADERQPSVSVIVLDDSCSMAASLGTETAFQRASARVRQVLGELGEDSRAALVLAADPPRAVVSQPTRDLVFIEQELARLQPRDSAANIPAALETARTILAGQEGPNHEVLLFSDGQENAWEMGGDDILRGLRDLAEDKCSLFLFLTPRPVAENVTVTDLVPEEGVIRTGRPTTFRVHLRSFAAEESIETPVELLMDGEKVNRDVVALPPGEESVIPLSYQVPFAGPHEFEARCGADVLDRDNGTFTVRTARERIETLLIDGRPSPEAARSAGGYLRAAISPTAEDSLTEPFIQVEKKGYDRAGPVDGAQVVILAEVDTLPQETLREIREMVRRGGGLLVIAGTSVDPDEFAHTFTSGEDPLLPIETGEIVRTPEGEKPPNLELTVPLHPALEVFEEAGLRDILTRVPFPSRLSVKETGGSAAVLASFTDGSPALIEISEGEGRILFFAGSADREGGTFPLNPAYVPFFREMVLYLATAPERDRDILAGESIVWRVPGEVLAPGPGAASGEGATAGEGAATIVRPDGTTENAARYLETGPSGEGRIVFDETGRAGVYLLRTTDESGQTRTERVAVNVPPEESVLDMLSPERVEALFPDIMWQVVEPEGNVREALRRGRFGTELWPYALLLLVGLVLLEAVLARAFGPKPVDTEMLAGTVG
jgi:hypothetical protein